MPGPGLGLGLGLGLSAGAIPYDAYALALDFDNSEYWSGGTKYNPLSAFPGYSFTRTGEQGAVDASGAVQWFAANTPAINGKGYHAYGALTNYHLQSNAMDMWGSSVNNTVVANDVVGPDGAQTGDTLWTTNTGTTTTSWRQYSASMTFPSAGKKTFAAILKRGNMDWFALQANAFTITGVGAANATCYYNLATGTVGTATNCTGYIVPLANGWYICVLVVDLDGTDLTGTLRHYFAAGDNDTTFLLDGTQYVHHFHSQALDGEFRDGGPLIRTTTAAASIEASSLAVSLANGTYSATYTFDDDTTQNNPALVIADGTLNLPADFTPNRNIIKQLLIP